MKLIITLLVCFSCSLFVTAQLSRPAIQNKKNWNMSSNQNILGSSKTYNEIVTAGYITDPTMSYLQGFFSVYDYYAYDTIISVISPLSYQNEFYTVAVCEGCYGSKTYSVPVVAAGYAESTPGDKDAYIYYLGEYWGDSYSVITQPYNQEIKHIRLDFPTYFYFCGYNEQQAGNKDSWFGRIYTPGSSSPSISSSKIFGGSGDDVLNSFDVSASSNFLAVGYTTTFPANGKDIKSIIYQSGQDTVMVDTLFQITGDQELYNVAYSDYYAGMFLGVGYSDTTGTNKDMLLVAFDEYSGDTLWTMTFGTPLEDVATSVRFVYTMGLRGFVVTGYSINANGDKETHLYLVDQNNYIISERIIGETGTDVQINTLELLPDGCSYFLFGQQDTEQTSFVTAAYDYSIDVIDAACYNTASGEINFIDMFSNYPNVNLWDSSYLNQIGNGYYYSGLYSELYRVDIEYMVGGGAKSICYMYDSVYVNQPDSFMISQLNYSDPDCSSDNGFINVEITGGTLPYSILWSTGADSLNLSGLWADVYNLYAYDSNECLLIDTNITLNFHALPYIDGYAETTFGNIAGTHAKAVLYSYGNTGGAAMLDSLTFSPIESNSLYTFSDIDTGSYAIKIMVDSTNYYPHVMNSYYSLNDTVILWQLADIITLSCDDTLHANVTMYEMNAMETGVGSISGYIYLFTYNKAVGEPVPGAEILIEQEPNDIPVQSAMTDNNGFYSVNGLEAGSSYRMKVEIPGYPMINTYTNLPITSSDTVYQQMNFYVDTTLNGGIMADTMQTIYTPVSFEKYSVNTYPNPFTNDINIDITVNENASLWIDAINIKGEEVVLIANEKVIKGKHILNWNPLQNISSGTYFLRIRVDNEVFIKKVLYQK